MKALPPRPRPVRLLLAAVAVLLAGLATVDLRPDRELTPPRPIARAADRGPLLAGAGKAPVDLPPDVVLAGYRAFGRKPERGAVPLHARALLLEAGSVRTALVLLELMTLPETLVEAVQERAREAGADCALVVATHTHSGPGGYDPSFLPQLVLGRYDRQVEAALLEAVENALTAARVELAPATLAVGEARVADSVSNRDHPGEPVDDRLTTLELLRGDGSRLAMVARVSAHPTLNPRRVGPSGDWPGHAMARLEAEEGVAFLLPGALADARARKEAAPGKGQVRAIHFGETMARMVEAVERERIPEPVGLGCAEVEFDLPPPDVTAMVPRGMGTLVSNLGVLGAPDRARAMAFRIGDLALVGLPAEAMGADAPSLETPAEEAGLEGRVVGVAQGYVSYGVGEREVEARTVSGRNAWFGAALRPRLVEVARAAVDALLGAGMQAAR